MFARALDVAGLQARVSTTHSIRGESGQRLTERILAGLADPDELNAALTLEVGGWLVILKEGMMMLSMLTW
jgi:hypothetical protein